jgi:hypothetical protein
MVEQGPFPDFSSDFWKLTNPAVLARENLVSKMHTIELLEQLSPYRGVTDPYFRRVWRAIDFLQQFSEVKASWLTAALVLFGNVIYLPAALLDDAWRSVYLDLAEDEFQVHVENETSKRPWTDLQLFENDPSGMIPAFCHLNRLEGRLDHEKYPRVDSTDKLADTILDVLHPLKGAAATQTVRKLFTKRVWGVLVDKSLSGHSLVSDIERLLITQHIALRVGVPAPKIVILCQVMTEVAEDALRLGIESVRTNLELESVPEVNVHKAVFLDRKFQVRDRETRLLRDRTLMSDVEELCRWFAVKFLKSNAKFERMRLRSKDDLEFGYRGCGLTLVDYQNCPTDSLPLLWHISDDGPQAYRGPYPRIQSRIGPQNVEPSADKWEQIKTNQEIGKILAVEEPTP